MSEVERLARFVATRSWNDLSSRRPAAPARSRTSTCSAARSARRNSPAAASPASFFITGDWPVALPVNFRFLDGDIHTAALKVQDH